MDILSLMHVNPRRAIACPEVRFVDVWRV